MWYSYNTVNRLQHIYCFTLNHIIAPNYLRHGEGCVCRIKTGHSNLVSCFGPRMRYLAEVFYRGESRGKIPCQRPNPRFEWPVSILIMTRHAFIPFKTHKTSAKNPRLLTITGAFDSAVTASARPPNCECTHLLLRSADWWRHNILFSIARTIWILGECKLSTDNFVNY